jgi:hypothetical protein
MATVFRWTGHFPEQTRSLIRGLAKRAEALRQVYPRGAEDEALVSVTTLVTSLAMNFVHRGAYFPETTAAAAAAAAAEPIPVQPLADTLMLPDKGASPDKAASVDSPTL